MMDELICPYCDSEDIISVSHSVDVYRCADCDSIFDLDEAEGGNAFRDTFFKIRRTRDYDDDDDDE